MNDIIYEYLSWLIDFVFVGMYSSRDVYSYLINYLCNTEYYICLEDDENITAYGDQLRYRFQIEHEIDDESMIKYFSDIPCSVFEVLVGLSIDIENDIMSDSNYGDRTSQWFWTMLDNLGLIKMTNSNFNQQETRERLETFMNRNYSCDGSNGGLFVVKSCPYDLATIGVWQQVSWYLTEFTQEVEEE